MKAAFVVFAVLAVVALRANAAVVCSEDQADGVVEYHPHPCNCHTYYVCMGTEPLPMSCPPGLHWDRVKNICNWPNVAKCKKASNC